MKIKELLQFFENIAPSLYQESYDNSRLITGNPNDEVTGVLVSLDCIEAVVDEAIDLGCNFIVSHHPIVFSGLKSLTGQTYIERTIIKAVKNNLAIYALHTNLDNIYDGVNKKICSMLGIENARVLQPKKGVLKKLVTFVPGSHEENVRQALFNTGAGKIGNYDHCSYNLNGFGTFRANEKANPFVGKAHETHHEPETRLEVIFDAAAMPAMLKALKSAHPYEEPAFDIYTLDNPAPHIGSGMLGKLPNAVTPAEFLEKIKTVFNTPVIRHTTLMDTMIETVAVCGGSGSFLLNDAIAKGAQVFVTSDYKYHQFFDADNRIIIADIGHYESEQFTINLIYDLLKENFPTFALHLTKCITNPVKYFI